MSASNPILNKSTNLTPLITALSLPLHSLFTVRFPQLLRCSDSEAVAAASP